MDHILARVDQDLWEMESTAQVGILYSQGLHQFSILKSFLQKIPTEGIT